MATIVRIVVVCLLALFGVATAHLEAQSRPSNLTATATGPTTVTLTWTAPPNAVRFWVQRAVGSASFANLGTPRITGTAYTDGGAPAGTKVSYRVIAGFSSGPHTYSDGVSVDTPTAPASSASSSPTTPAPVQPTSPPPSSGQASSVPSPGQPITNVTLAPRDPRQFVAVPTAAPAPAAAAAPAPAAPSPAPAVTSGRYRVVANGFSVVQQAHSHHDDVYGGFVMLHFNRQTGELMDRDARHTKVLGDINGRVFGETDGGSFNRFRAGTASPTGGLKNGDSYPDAGHARFRGQDGAPPNRETFPFEVWTGDLTNASDAVVILPTLWSRDGKTQPFDDWQNAEITAASQIWYDQAVQQALHQTTLGVVAPPGAVTPNGNQQFAKLAELVGLALVGGMGQPWALSFAFDPSAHDFPIGFDASAKALPRRAIVLTREMIEQALGSPPAPLSPTMLVPNYPAWILGYLTVPVGVIPVLLFDYVPPPGEPLRPSYVMYLQVERV